MTNLAMRAGAEVVPNSRVEGWQVLPNQQIKVNAGDQVVTCERLIVTAGAWAPELIGEVCGKIKVLRKTQHWYQLDRVEIKQEAGFSRLSDRVGPRRFLWITGNREYGYEDR